MNHNNTHLDLQVQTVHADLKEISICFKDVDMLTAYFGGKVQNTQKKSDEFKDGHFRFRHTAAAVIAGVPLIVDYQLTPARMKFVLDFVRQKKAYDHVMMSGLKQQNCGYSAFIWIKSHLWTPTSSETAWYISTFPPSLPLCKVSEFCINLAAGPDKHEEHPLSCASDKPGWKVVLNLAYQLQGTPIYPGHYITAGQKKNAVFVGIGLCDEDDRIELLLSHNNEVEYYSLATKFEDLSLPDEDSKKIVQKTVEIYALGAWETSTVRTSHRKSNQAEFFSPPEKKKKGKKGGETTPLAGKKGGGNPPGETKSSGKKGGGNSPGETKSSEETKASETKAQKTLDKKNAKISEQKISITDLEVRFAAAKLKLKEQKAGNKPDTKTTNQMQTIITELAEMKKSMKSVHEQEDQAKQRGLSGKNLSSLFASVGGNEGNDDSLQSIVANVIVPLVEKVVVPLINVPNKAGSLQDVASNQKETNEFRKMVNDFHIDIEKARKLTVESEAKLQDEERNKLHKLIADMTEKAEKEKADQEAKLQREDTNALRKQIADMKAEEAKTQKEKTEKEKTEKKAEQQIAAEKKRKKKKRKFKEEQEIVSQKKQRKEEKQRQEKEVKEKEKKKKKKKKQKRKAAAVDEHSNWWWGWGRYQQDDVREPYTGKWKKELTGISC
jgi:hypothetical protein